MDLASKHKLIFCKSLPFQNVPNNYSESKTHRDMPKQILEVKIELNFPRPRTLLNLIVPESDDGTSHNCFL